MQNQSYMLRNFQLKEAGGRQKGFFQKGIQTPPEKEQPNFQFGGGLKPLLPMVVARGTSAVFPLQELPSSCLLDKKNPINSCGVGDTSA